MAKTILFLTGPSCAGKSTIRRILSEQTPNNYLVSMDALKQQLAGYDRDTHGDVIQRLSLGYLDVVCAEGFFVFLEIRCLDESEYALLYSIAEKYDYNVIVIQVTASEDILMKRCRERIAKAISEGRRMSIMDEDIYKKRLETSHYFPEGTEIVDTSEISIEKATLAVQEIIKNKVRK